MKTIEVPISQLVENPINTRIHTEKQIKEFMKSIDMFGVVRPIVVDENNMILIGHGLKKALEQMGRETADVLRVSGLTENEKKKLLLSDNKIFELGVNDFDAIDSLIRDLQDFEIPGYSPENLEMLYGTSSLAENQAEFKQTEEQVAEKLEKRKKAQETIQSDGIVASKQVQQERQEQQKAKFIICPHCGGKIYAN